MLMAIRSPLTDHCPGAYRLRPAALLQRSITAQQPPSTDRSMTNHNNPSGDEQGQQLPALATSCLQMARFLSHLRSTGRGIPVNAAEALLLIAAGVDHVSDLQAAMPDEKGQPLSGATTARLVGLLRGRARYAAGNWIESPFSLVEVRKHPHRRGQQLALSSQGQKLICAFLTNPTPE